MSRRNKEDVDSSTLSETELREEIRSLNAQAAGREFDAEERARWDLLNEKLHERTVRMERIRELSGRPSNLESEEQGEPTVRRVGRGIRGEVPAHLEQMRSRALTAIDRHTDVLSAQAAGTLERYVEDDLTGPARGINSEYLAAVGNPAYMGAFGKTLAEPLSAHLKCSAS
jgi:hypothetical protein